MIKKLKLLVFICLTTIIAGFGETGSAVYSTDNINREKPQLVLQTGHSETVNRVIFGNDHKWLASSGQDNTVKIWETATGRELRTFDGHTAPVKSLAVSRDEKLLASGGNDQTIRIWNVADGRVKHILNGHQGSVETIVFSHDRKFLASGGTDSLIKIWDVETGNFLYDLAGHLGWITALAFSPDGQTLASCSADDSVKIWEIGKNRKERTVETHKNRITALTFNHDGQLLASGSSDGKIKISAFYQKRRTFNLNPNTGKILSLMFLPNDNLISGDSQQSIKTWDVKQEREISAVKPKSTTVEEIESAAVSSDGAIFAAGTGSRTIELTKIESGEHLTTLKSHTVGLYSVAFSGDERWLATGGNDNTVKLFDLKSGQAAKPLVGHTGYVTGTLFTPDGKKLISSSIDGTIKFWDLATGKAVSNFAEHTGSVNSIAVSFDGRRLASGGQDKSVRLWNLETAKSERILKNHNDEVTAVEFSPDGRFLTSGSLDKTVRLWDLNNAQSQPRIIKTEGVESVAFSPDGHWLAFAAGGKINLWNLKTDRQEFVITENAGKVYALKFSSDSQKIIFGSSDKTIKIWQISSKSVVKTLNEHTGVIHSIAFDGKGKWLISSSEDGKTILWNTATFKSAATLVSNRNGNEWLVVSPDGLFDGSPAAWNEILWRFSDETFNTQPVETFFNEFYKPGLLADIIAENPIELPDGKDISKIDRRQPKVNFLSINDQPLNSAEVFKTRTIKIKIEVIENTDKTSQPNHPAGSGAKDLRLFRNGSLVKVWSDDIFARNDDCHSLKTEPNAPRHAVCETVVPITAGENDFSGYVFNGDNVKSLDSDLIIKGSENLRRQGNVSVLAVGINKYEDADYNLKFAVADADELSAELQTRQKKLKIYAAPEVFTLTDAEATKQNILYALKRFADGNAAEKPSDISPKTEKKLAAIEKTQPEDALLIYFAGHGFAAENRFYLIPHDLGENSNREILRQKSISDVELENVLRDLDVGELLMVIDACNSGQALEAAEKRRGPMNSRGLAQLAYEKGMYILTAAQSYQAALEVSRTPEGKKIEHGLLTFSLIESLTNAKTDADSDKEITEREWFAFAVEEVPRMQLEEMKRRSVEIKRSATKVKGQSELFYTGKDDEDLPPEKRGLQTPRVFYRRETAVKPFVVSVLSNINRN